MRLWDRWQEKCEKARGTTVGLIKPGRKVSLTDETAPINDLEFYAYANRLRWPKLPPLSRPKNEAK